MIDSLHFGVLGVSVGGYKIITPKKIFSTSFDSRYKSIERQKIEAGEIVPSPSIMEIDSSDSEIRTYDPLDVESLSEGKDSALFRIFAGLQTDDYSIIAFANQYGLLGEGFLDKVMVGEYLEPISTWSTHIAKMKKAVELWDNIQQKNSSWLSKRFIWTGGKRKPLVKYKHGNNSESIARYEIDDYLIKQLTYGKTELPARLYLQRLINKEKEKRVISRLLFKADWSGQHNVITAKNLLGFMWLQLSLSVEGNLKYSNCLVCGKPFRLDPLKRGKPRRFCSNACKSKDYRDRRKLTVKDQ